MSEKCTFGDPSGPPKIGSESQKSGGPRKNFFDDFLEIAKIVKLGVEIEGEIENNRLYTRFFLRKKPFFQLKGTYTLKIKKKSVGPNFSRKMAFQPFFHEKSIPDQLF